MRLQHALAVIATLAASTPAAANGCRDVPTDGRVWEGSCTHRHSDKQRSQNYLERQMSKWMGPLTGPQTGRP